MRLLPAILFFLLAMTSGGLCEPSEKEIVALMNKVQRSVAEGNVKALDELTTLPGKFATPAFLTIFKQTYYIASATPTQKAIGARCAQLALSTSGGEEYLVNLLKGKPANNYIFYQQDSAIKCLAILRHETAIRILGGALADVDRDEISPKLTRALASLNLPGAPISPKDRVSDAEALAKWQKWWATHRSDYSG